MSAGTKRLKGPLPAKLIGVIVVTAITIWGIAAFSTARIGSFLSPGDTVQAEFSREYKTRDFEDRIKLAGVPVGEITGTEKTDHGTTLVTMRVDHGILEKLGDTPRAELRPTLVVGGIYYVSLVPGGKGNSFPDGGTIPIDRTTVPVELDRVLTTINPPAQSGIRTSLRELDGTLARGGTQAAKDLLHNAPATLPDTGVVLQAAEGTRPSTDLPQLVDGLERTAAVLNHRQGQLANVLDTLDTTTGALAASSRPLGESIRTAPETLRTARAGLDDLRPTLERLQEVAPKFQPSARELAKTLDELQPVLSHTRPVVKDLRELLQDARPLVDKLSPTADRAKDVLDDVRGPVLDRVNGPIMTTLNTKFTGQGPAYTGGGDEHKFYEETAYLLGVGADVFKFYDKNGGMARLSLGFGAQTIGGFSQILSLEQFLEAYGANPPGPQEGGSTLAGLPALPGATATHGPSPLTPLTAGLTGRPGS